MNYEKLYKEALEKAQKELQYCGTLDCDAARQMIYRFFPELHESDDERIRKEIIKHLISFNNGCYKRLNEDIIDNWLAWLEKQGEQKPKEEYDVPDTPIKDSEVVTSRIKYIDENLKPIAEFIIDYANWDLRKDKWNHPVVTVPLFRVLDALIQNGKPYSEEYSVSDNNTLKFKVGDWVVYNNCHQSIYQVEKIEDGYYILRHTHGGTFRVCILHDENLRLWTIEDAKDGDVLAAHECLVLFKEIDGLNIRCYCTYHYLNHQKFYIDTLQNKTAFCPATKEQCDLLFQEMKKEGYEWDAEKKELTKNM